MATPGTILECEHRENAIAELGREAHALGIDGPAFDMPVWLAKIGTARVFGGFGDYRPTLVWGNKGKVAHVAAWVDVRTLAAERRVDTGAPDGGIRRCVDAFEAAARELLPDIRCIGDEVEGRSGAEAAHPIRLMDPDYRARLGLDR